MSLCIDQAGRGTFSNFRCVDDCPDVRRSSNQKAIETPTSELTV